MINMAHGIHAYIRPRSKEEEQVRLFKQRLKPIFVSFTDCVTIVRGIRGLRKPVNDAAQWSDFVRFEPHEIKDISIWNAFVERYSHFLQFDHNPLRNKLAFVQELFELYEFLGSNRTVTNSFIISRDNPIESHGIEVARDGEKFASERYPAKMSCEFQLKWVVRS